ncbi:MAG TPA: GAF and ANTAR domain-containing protein [Actinomycetales bacterium]
MRQALTDLSRILHAQLPLTQHLQRVAEIAIELIPCAREASITLLTEPGERRAAHDQVRSVAFTGPLALQLDERQYDRGYGPCLDAAISGATIVLDTAVDTESDRIYPDFSAQCRALDVGHVVALALPVPARTVGALNLYAAGPFSAEDIEAGTAFAGYAGIAMANALLLDATADDARHLTLAMESRAVIEQAKGLVMASLHCTPEEAFDVLRRRSQHSNVKLRDLCREIVESFSGAAAGPRHESLTLPAHTAGSRTHG